MITITHEYKKEKEKMNPIIKRIMDQMQSVMNQRKAELDDRISKLDEAKKALAKAELDKKAATEANDDAAFLKGGKAYADAAIAIEMHQKRIDYLKEHPMIERSKGEALAQKLCDALEAQNAEDVKRFVDLIAKASSIGKESRELNQAVSNMLKTWQYGACGIPNHEQILNVYDDRMNKIMMRLSNDINYRNLLDMLHEED